MNKKNLILYVHGWNSHAKARKAELLKNELQNHNSFEATAISLKNHPREAVKQLIEFIESKQDDYIVHLIGSSLGGFFGIYFAEKYDLLCVNINPAIPPIDMSEYLGENQNYSTGEKFVIDQDQLDWLGLMNKKIKNLKKHKNFMTLVQSGDEVLDYKLAIEYFSGSQIDITFGGDHSFEDFESHIQKIQNFLNMH